MAKVRTVVPRCPWVVGEIGIVTDWPFAARPAGDVGPYLLINRNMALRGWREARIVEGA